MKRCSILLGLSLFAAAVAAQEPTCVARSAEKKLAGAAQTSFMKRCKSDALKACEAQAAERKLFGAAKTSFVRRCATQAEG